MLCRTELLVVFILAESGIAVLVLGASYSTVGACAVVGLTLTKGTFYALDTLVNGVLSACYMDIIHMFGRGQIIARLETPRGRARVGGQNLRWSF
eukprot:8822540-Pyramimonas_sp.AAC.1